MTLAMWVAQARLEVRVDTLYVLLDTLDGRMATVDGISVVR
jgi:hypothetical protein